MCLTSLALLGNLSTMKHETKIYTLGNLLKEAREAKELSLRAVEAETGISNPYLSQLEKDKIKDPSPRLLYKLCEFYEISYNTAMELAGYPSVSERDETPKVKRLAARFGNVTDAEERELADYLKFLRTRRNGGNR